MKPRASLRRCLLIAAASHLVGSAAPAATLYWDGGSIDIAGNGNGASGGGAGTWNTTIKNWDIGAVPYTNWNSSNPDYAVIAGSAATITLGSGITTSGIDFLGNGYILDASVNGLAFGSGSNQLRIAGNNWAATINGSISGTGDMHLESIFAGGQPTTGNSQPVFNFIGTSTGGWEGETTLRRPITLSMSENNQVLESTSAINLQGGTIQITNTDTTNLTDRINDNAAITIDGGGSIRITNSNIASQTYTESVGDVTLNSGYAAFLFTVNLNTAGTTQTLILDSFTRNNHSVVSFGPSATAAGKIQVTGATQTAASKIIGAWALHGNGNTNNDYAVYDASGNVVARAATNTVETTWSTAWADTANIATNTATQTLTADREMNTLRFANASSFSVGENKLATYGILNGAGNYTIDVGTNGFITVPDETSAGTLYLTQGNGNLTVNAPIKDNGSTKLTLVLGGNHGALNLNGNSDYTGGTVISRSSVRNSATNGAGNVNVGHANALGASTNYLQFDSGSLNLNGFSVTVGAFTGGPSAQVVNTTGTGILTVGSGTASNSASNFEGSISGGLLVKTGDGTQILSGANNAAATAQYTVNSGTLQFAKVDSFYAGSVYGSPNTANWTKARTIVNSGATLAFNVGGDREFTAAQINTIMTNLGGSNAANEGFQAGSRLGLDTTNAVGGTFTQGNAIADSSGAGGGAIGLTKLGTGILVLDKVNTYTGGTSVADGTLVFRNTAAKPASGTHAFAAGTTLGLGVGGAGLFGSDDITNAFAGTMSGNLSNVTVAATTNVAVDTTAGDFTYSADITGSPTRGLTKLGTGTFTITSAVTYTGGTFVEEGTLVVAGSLGNSAVSVSNPGTLLATDAAAAFGGTVTINNEAIFAVGGNGSAGTATITGNTTFKNGSTFSWDINANGTVYDKVVGPGLAGEAAEGDAVFQIVVADSGFTNGFWTANQTWTDIFMVDGTNPISDWADLFSVAVVDSDLDPLSTDSFGTFSIDGNTLTWTVIPEPTTALGGLLLTAGLLRRRRKLENLRPET